MNNKFYCDVCHTEMIMVKRLKNTKVKWKVSSMRVRRFECVCGYKKTIFGDGVRDEQIEPNQAIEEASDDVNYNYGSIQRFTPDTKRDMRV